MEKIILAMDGHHQNMYAVDFACYIARQTHSRLTGVFLEGAQDGTGTRAVLREPITVDEYVREDSRADKVGLAVEQFRMNCMSRDVAARVHRDRGIPLNELVEESRFSDLVVLDPETSLEGGATRTTNFVEQFLHRAECPVILAPYQFNTIETIYFAFDDSGSSMYAIKQFTYLFPEFSSRKARLVHVTGSSEPFPGEIMIKEWLTAHYTHLDFEQLYGDAGNQLLDYLMDRKDGIVVMGAYGRSTFSRALFPSHARLLIKAVNLPLFIAHR